MGLLHQAELSCKETDESSFVREMKRRWSGGLEYTPKLNLLLMTMLLPACMHAQQHARLPDPHKALC